MRLRKTFSYFTISLLALAALSGCETDVDLIAPYKTTPVIFGVLDHTADTQFVRINRTFLGEGNVNVYAGIKDSVEYPIDQVQAMLYKYNGNNLVDSIALEAIDLPTRDPGVFYRENVRFYYTAEPLFTTAEIQAIEDMTYELRVNIKDKEYTATTGFPKLSTGDITSPPLRNPPFRLEMVANSGALRTLNFEFETDPSVLEYEAVFRINFDYYTASGEYFENRDIDFSLGSIGNPNGASTERKVVFSSADWFDFLGKKLDEIPGLKNVRIDHLEFRLTAGTADLVNYMQVARPVSDFTPVLSSYTNISGDAIGVFAAIGQMGRMARLGEAVLLALNTYPQTGAYCYCVLDWAGSGYVCNPDPAICY